MRILSLVDGLQRNCLLNRGDWEHDCTCERGTGNQFPEICWIWTQFCQLHHQCQGSSPGDKVDPDNAMHWEHKQEIALGTENERDLLVLPVSLKAHIPQGLCEDMNKIIKYRPYIHHVIHPGLLSQLEVFACPVWYIQKITAMKRNCLYLQVCLNFLSGL